MKTCPDNSERLLYAADELPAARRRAFESHLAACDACRAETAALVRGLTLLHDLPEAPAPRPEMTASLRRRLALAADERAAQPRFFRITQPARWAAAAAVLVAAVMAFVLWPKPDATTTPQAEPAQAIRWVDDLHVQDELAEITAGIEMLEAADYGRVRTNGAAPKPAPAGRSIDEEVERMLQELSDEFGVSG